MNNPLRSEASVGLGLLAARLPLGVMFVLSGVAKFRLAHPDGRPGGVAHYVDTVKSQLPHYIPPDAGERFLAIVPYAQAGLGVLLIAGLLTRVSGLGAVLLSAAFGLILGFVDRGAVDASGFLTEPTKFLAYALVALLAGPGMFSVDRLLFGRPADRSKH